MKTQDPVLIKSLDKKIPLRATMYLTWSCNQRCIHCYDALPKSDDWSLQRIKEKIGYLASKGCLFLSFSGGEPLLRKDFFQIAEYAKKKNFALALETNGSLITKENIKKLKDLNFAHVRVSIFGGTKSTHEQITKVFGSFDKTINTLKLLKENDIKSMIQFVCLKENEHELDQVKKLASLLKIELKVLSGQNIKKHKDKVCVCYTKE